MSHHESSFESQEERQKLKLMREIGNRLNGNGQEWNKLGDTLLKQANPEIALGALEDLFEKSGYLSDSLQDVYIENLEDFYTERIRSCEQDPDRIDEKMEEIENRLSKLDINDEKINLLRNRISSWAYNPETA